MAGSDHLISEAEGLFSSIFLTGEWLLRSRKILNVGRFAKNFTPDIFTPSKLKFTPFRLSAVSKLGLQERCDHKSYGLGNSARSCLRKYFEKI